MLAILVFFLVFVTGVDSDTTRGNGSRLKEGRLGLGVKKTFFYNKCTGALAQVARRGGGCPIPGNTQGQAGWALGT